jgi:uncharacterized protein (UPF0332 family)
MSVVLDDLLSRKVYDRLREEARRLNVSVEELVVDIILKTLNISLDPNDRVEFYLRLCEKFLSEAEEFLARGDYVQASEKGWGAATQIVKALAVKEGRELRSHGELHKEVVKIIKELGDDELRHLWQSAISLHQNFYEGWLPKEMIEKDVEDIKKFVEKLRKYL